MIIKRIGRPILMALRTNLRVHEKVAVSTLPLSLPCVVTEGHEFIKWNNENYALSFKLISLLILPT